LDNCLDCLKSIAESGDENLVLGLCIDKSSVYESVNVDLGDQEQKELPSRCLLVCLTLEGKLIIFNVARYDFLLLLR